MALRVDIEPEIKLNKQPQDFSPKVVEKPALCLKIIPPSLIASITLGACQLKSVEGQISPLSSSSPVGIGENLPAEETPINLNIDSISFKNGYPPEFAPYADVLGSMAKKDGVDPQILECQWIKAEGKKGKIDYTLVPFATVTGLTDPDGVPSERKPVYFLTYPNKQGNIQGKYAVGKLIETDSKGRVSFTGRIVDDSTFESWKNNTQSPQTKLGQIIYAIPLKEEVTVEQAKQIQKDFTEGKLTQEQLLSQYAIGLTFIQPDKPDSFVSLAISSAVQPPTQEPDLLKQAFTKLLGVTPAAAAGVEYSATLTPEEPNTASTEAVPTTAILTPEPTATATELPIPTLNPELVNGLEGIPDPKITNPELFDLQNTEAPIPQFVNALKNAGIEVSSEQIASGITFVSTKDDGTPLVDQDGNPYVVAVYNLDPDPTKISETLEGPIPIMIAEKGEKGWGWEMASLKKSNIIGINSGTLLGGYGFAEYYNDLIRVQNTHFNFGMVDTGAPSAWIGPNNYNYQYINNDVRLGRNNNMNMMNHLLIWPSVIPYWLRNGNYSKEEMMNLLRNWVSNTMRRYPEITVWEVVNEFGNNDFFQQRLGNDYLVEMFRTAREARPNAVLIYNDFANHSLNDRTFPNGQRTIHTQQVIQTLRQDNLIDGVGIQMILYADNIPTKEDIINTLRSYGVPVYITEFQVIMTNIRGTREERLLRQAEIYKMVCQAILQSGTSNTIIFFNQSDKVSPWENDRRLPQYSPNADPTLFDDNYQPKLAYYAVLQALFK